MSSYEEYDWQDTDPSGFPIPPRLNLPAASPTDANSFSEKMADRLAYFIGNSVIPRLAYPGTMQRTLNRFRWILPPNWRTPPLEKAAAWLVNQMQARRFRLKTRTGNTIDSMMVDRRENPHFQNGDILVITCEGNYTFYEDGVSEVPLRLGYSVLMWNHPGYGKSSGYPSPSEETAAIDVVVQFAIFGCGWMESEIVVYGWSIGGYTASWAAMNYPNLRGVILDATFDDFLFVAERYVPTSMRSVLTRAIRRYWNLDIAQQLIWYKGPVILIRRAQDQIMSVAQRNETAMRRTNRMNWLLKALLQDRYPGVFGQDETLDPVIDEWLEGDEAMREYILESNDIEGADWIKAALTEYVQEIAILNQDGVQADIFPMSIGSDYDPISRRQMALFLVSKHLTEVNTDHYTVLTPKETFVVPCDPWESDDDVVSVSVETVAESVSVADCETLVDE